MGAASVLLANPARRPSTVKIVGPTPSARPVLVTGSPRMKKKASATVQTTLCSTRTSAGTDELSVSLGLHVAVNLVPSICSSKNMMFSLLRFQVFYFSYFCWCRSEWRSEWTGG